MKVHNRLIRCLLSGSQHNQYYVNKEAGYFNYVMQLKTLANSPCTYEHSFLSTLSASVINANAKQIVRWLIACTLC